MRRDSSLPRKKWRPTWDAEVKARLEGNEIDTTGFYKACWFKDVSPNVVGRYALELLDCGVRYNNPEKWVAAYLHEKAKAPRVMSPDYADRYLKGRVLYTKHIVGTARGEYVVEETVDPVARYHRRGRRSKKKRERGWRTIERIKTKHGHFVVSFHPMGRRLSVSQVGGVHVDGFTMSFNTLRYQVQKILGSDTQSRRRKRSPAAMKSDTSKSH